MLNEKSYHLYIQRYLKILILGILALFTIIGILMITGLFQSSKGEGPPRIIGVFWLGMVGWYIYWVFSLPHTITVSASGQVQFIGVLRKRQTSLREIQSIKPNSQFGFLVVKTTGGKFRLFNQFDEFHDFIMRLKASNPAVELRGC